MNLRQLRYFTKVVEIGNITRAAEALHVAQPALGLQIRQLEGELKVGLLVRHSRGVTPTEAGRLLCERGLAILREVEATRRDVMATAGRSWEAIRLGLSPSQMAMLGPDLVLRARASFPDLQVSLVEGLSHMLVDLVERDELDLALASDAEVRPGLTQTLLLEEDLVLVTLPGRLPTGTVTLAKMLELDLVLAGHRDSVRRAVESAAQRLSVTPVVAFEVQSVAAMKRMVVRELGVTVLPRGAVAEELARGELEVRRIVEPALSRSLYLVRPSHRLSLRHEPDFVALVKRMVEEHAETSAGLARLTAPPVRARSGSMGDPSAAF